MKINLNRIFFPVRKVSKNNTLNLGGKLTAAILSIVAVLGISCLVGVLEFRRMSNYVNSRISENVDGINLASHLNVALDEYNNCMLRAVGGLVSGQTDSTGRISLIASESVSFDPTPYKQEMDALIVLIQTKDLPNFSTVKASYKLYMEESLNFDSANFIVARDWYYNTLQPLYGAVGVNIDAMNKAIQTELQQNSVSFDEGFRRSVMPTLVSLVIAIVMCLLLLFFILSYYVKPLDKMLRGLDAYSASHHPYKNAFDGDDELQRLNTGITELVDENILLRKKISGRPQ